jgi:NAD+ kinase
MLLGIIPNLGKPSVPDLLESLIEHLETSQIRVMLPVAAAKHLERSDLGFTDQEMAQDCTVIMVLGGDGTLISIARRWPFWGVPLIGVNLGHLGFMTEVEEDGALYALNVIMAGEFRLQDRMMLKATVLRENTKVVESFALNECVVTKGAFSRMLRFDVYIGRSFLETFPADGIIVSTPTGSTAYSLSAGGPIVDPAMELMLLTPICAHMLQARPVVISPRDRIRIRLRASHEDIALTLDGQESFRLYPSDEIILERADIVTRLVKLAPRSFYDVLRRKLYETPMGEEQKRNAGTPID